jgi:hypothetical protein
MLPVLPQASSMLETPVIAMSIELEMIASVITPARRDDRPLHLDVLHAERCGVLLDQLLLLHDDRLDVDQAGLARDTEFVRFGSRRGRREGRKGESLPKAARRNSVLKSLPPFDVLRAWTAARLACQA